MRLTRLLLPSFTNRAVDVPGGQFSTGGEGQYVAGAWPIKKAWLAALMGWRWMGLPEWAAKMVKAVGVAMGVVFWEFEGNVGVEWEMWIEAISEGEQE